MVSNTIVREGVRVRVPLRAPTLLSRSTYGFARVGRTRWRDHGRRSPVRRSSRGRRGRASSPRGSRPGGSTTLGGGATGRSEEHTSELQSRRDLVCRLLLEKK